MISTLAFAIYDRMLFYEGYNVGPVIDGVYLTEMISAFETKQLFERVENYHGIFCETWSYDSLESYFFGRWDPEHELEKGLALANGTRQIGSLRYIWRGTKCTGDGKVPWLRLLGFGLNLLVSLWYPYLGQIWESSANQENISSRTVVDA